MSWSPFASFAFVLSAFELQTALVRRTTAGKQYLSEAKSYYIQALWRRTKTYAVDIFKLKLLTFVSTRSQMM